MGIMAFSSIIIIAFALVNHPNLCLSNQKVEKYKKLSRKALFLGMICIALAILLNVETICITYTIAGLGVDAILLCIAKTIKEVKAIPCQALQCQVLRVPPETIVSLGQPNLKSNYKPYRYEKDAANN